MPRTKISEFSSTAADNTDIDGINLAEGMLPSDVNNAIRELMSQLKDFQAGTASDSFNGPIGTSTAAAGRFTTIGATGDVSIADKIIHTGDTNTAIRFPAADTITAETSGVERLRIDTSGNVGIGTSSPSGKLDVAGSTSRIRWDLSSTYTYQASTNVAGSAFAVGYIDAASHQFQIASVTKMIIDSSGNVGIGTSSPLTKTEIVGGKLQVCTGGVLGFAGSAGINLYTAAGANIRLYDDSNSCGINTVPSGGASSLAFSTSGTTERMRIDSSGNLLVGVTSAISGANAFTKNNANNRVVTFTNSGNEMADQNIWSNLGSNNNSTNSYHFICDTGGSNKLYIYGNGNIVNTNNSYGALSDQSIKENIVDASPKLADLIQIKVRNYNLIADESKTKQIGVVAQELEEVFPSMIEVDGISGHKQVKYSVFVPMLIKAIQEQQAIITDLKARIETLESK